MNADARIEEESQGGVPNAAVSNWRLFVGTGVVLVLLGVIATFGTERILAGLGDVLFALPFAANVAVSLLFGVLSLLAGTVITANCFGARGWKGSRIQAVLAAVYSVGGLVFLLDPLLGLASSTVLLFGFLLVVALLEMGIGLRTRPGAGWPWLVLGGVVALMAGIVVWTVSFDALRTVGLVFGVNLSASGVSLVVTGWGRRKAARTPDVTPSSGTAHR